MSRGFLAGARAGEPGGTVSDSGRRRTVCQVASGPVPGLILNRGRGPGNAGGFFIRVKLAKLDDMRRRPGTGGPGPAAKVQVDEPLEFRLSHDSESRSP